MSEGAEKTEQPTQRRLEDAQKRGQIPRSAEIQTVMVLLGGVLAFSLYGTEIWQLLSSSVTGTLGHLHDISLSTTSIQGHAVRGTLVLLACVGPPVLAILVSGLLAGGMQSRFQTASEALDLHWERINPVTGLQRVFSLRSGVPTLLAMVKLAALILLTYSTIQSVLSDPIFTTTVHLGHIAAFMANSCLAIFNRVILALAVIAATDYGYQYWRTWQDLMMTRDELKEETKNQEGNAQVKGARKRLMRVSQRKMLAAIPTADVVVTNPTRIAVALRYDPATMKAPRLVAKGIRLNAARIREIARQYQIPILENKPLARLLFKHGRVGGEVPAQLYVAVAEVLAWVYRTNPYRYYTAGSRSKPRETPASDRQEVPEERVDSADRLKS